MLLKIGVAQVERVHVGENGRAFVTLRDMDVGGVVELSADAAFAASLAEGALVQLEAVCRGYGYPSDGGWRFGLRLVDGRVSVLPSISEMLSAVKQR